MIYGLLRHIAIKKVTKTKGAEEKFDEMSGKALRKCLFAAFSTSFLLFWG